MTFLQITAILSLLAAFNVDALTISKVHDIFLPPEATTTQVAVIQTPIVPDAPVYFGGAPVTITEPAPREVITITQSPAPAPAPAPAPVLPPPDTTPPEVDISLGTQFAPDRIQQISLWSNEPITFSIDRGLLGNPIANGEPTKDGVHTVYFYRVPIEGLPTTEESKGIPQYVHVTMTDAAGNSVTKGVLVR